MAECSLDLIFSIRDRPFVFLVGGGGGGGGAGADFFQQLKLDFFIDKVKVFFFCNKFYLQLLLAPIHLFSFSFIK